MVTHIIPAFAHATRDDQFIALCGEKVSGWSHAPNGDPTCPVCKRIDEEDGAALLALQQAPAESFGGPPVTHQPFDPCADYVPRGQRRRR